jgi:hypothetical protein
MKHPVLILLLTILASQAIGQDFEVFQKNNKYGIKDAKGKIIVPTQYDEIECCNECFWGEIAFRIKLNGKYGFLNKQAKEIIPAKYDAVGSCWQGDLFAVELNGKWGYINTSGSEIVPLKYDEVEDVSSSFSWAKVKLNNKYGFIDNTGKEIIPLKYDKADNTTGDDLVCVGLKTTCDSVKEKSYDEYGNEIEQKLLKCNYKYGAVNMAGKEIISFLYDDAFFFHEGIAMVNQNSKYGFIDNNGKEISPCNYEGYRIFPPNDEKLIAMMLNGKWGFIDYKSGKEIIPFKYDDVSCCFEEGKGNQVKLGNKVFYIDKNGKELSK